MTNTTMTMSSVSPMSTLAPPCPESLYISNIMVYVTIAIGIVSTLLVIFTILLIFAYNSTKRSLRERILLGLFCANLLYSIANTVPYFAYTTKGDECGDYLESGPITGSIAPALWYFGKFSMVAFEMFIVIASIHALRTGKSYLGVAVEAVSHGICTGIGLSAFFVFFFQSKYYNTQLQLNSARSTPGERDAFSDAMQGFADTNSFMLDTWLALTVIVFALWGYQRFLLGLLMMRWREAAEAQELRRKPDYLLTPTDKLKDNTVRKVLDLQKQSYLEVAKPLEKYVIVFAVFSPPAIIMCLPFCVKLSAASSQNNVVNCDAVCVMILALRSIATVVVYLRERYLRDELVGPIRAIQMIHKRHSRTNVGFKSDHEVRLFGDEDDETPSASRRASLTSEDSLVLHPTSYVRDNNMSIKQRLSSTSQQSLRASTYSLRGSKNDGDDDVDLDLEFDLGLRQPHGNVRYEQFTDDDDDTTNTNTNTSINTDHNTNTNTNTSSKMVKTPLNRIDEWNQHYEGPA